MMLVILMGTGMTSCEFFNDNPISPRLKVRVSSMEVQVGASRKCNVSASTRAKLLYASSNEAIATVDEKGIVTGVSEGDAVITVIATNKDLDIFFDESAVIAVKVVAKDTKADDEEVEEGDIELTYEDLSPELKAATEAKLLAVQKEGATIGIKFSYDGVDYNASFEKTDGEDYKLTAFTSSKTATIEETKKLAAFTPYLTLLIPDDWTDEQIDAYIDSISDDDEGDEEDVDEESDVDESDGDEGDEGDEDDDDEGDEDEGDEDDSEYTDKLIFTDVDGVATARAMTRTTAVSAAFDMLFGLRTASDEDLVQVQINTAGASATIVGETDLFTIKSISTSDDAYVTARTRAEAYTKKLTIKVNKKGSKKVSSVTLTPNPFTITKTAAQTMTAKVSPQGAKIKKIVWKTNNSKFAMIAKNGMEKLSIKVKPRRNGSTKISAIIGPKTGFLNVSIKIPVTYVKLSKKTLELTEGESATLKATVNPTAYVSQAVTWKSSKTAVAKVDKNGKVTAVGAGTAIITATSKDNKSKKAQCTVTVTDPQPAPDLPKTMTVQATDYSGTYDGKAHGISISVTEPASGYSIKYGEKEGTYDKTSLTYTDAGTYTVYYRVTCDGYEPVTGSAKVVISPQGTISDPDDYGKGGNLF